eukprot:4579076-Pleurochrysis_carterae.AAC.1
MQTVPAVAMRAVATPACDARAHAWTSCAQWPRRRSRRYAGSGAWEGARMGGREGMWLFAVRARTLAPEPGWRVRIFAEARA